MKLSDAGKRMIKGFEGLSLKAYPDAAGYSIGYGHFGASPGQTISQSEADRLFDGDVQRFEAAVNRVTPVTTQNQFDAMVSLAYNIGEGASPGILSSGSGFAGSTVARLHNQQNFQGAGDAFRMWKKSQGVDHPGLIARREKERAAYLGLGYPDGTPAASSQPPEGEFWPEAPVASKPATGPGFVVGILGLAAFGFLFLRAYK